jgi:pseudouridine-5'-phosphate glycosidase
MGPVCTSISYRVRMSLPLALSPDVAAALEAGDPVVALESTIISHGLPRPRNLEAARDFEAILHDRGVVPATIAVLDGVLKVGLTDDELRRIAQEDVVKVSVRDLPVVVARGGSVATTVAATSFIAALGGVRVFATGGLGGVHRGASQTYDESADLTILSEVPVTVVSAGVKSILDIPATLERLETLSVTVVGYGTDEFPSFWLTSSGEHLDWSVPDGEAVAAVMAANDALGRRTGILVANPLPADRQLDPAVHDAALAQALGEAEGMTGKDVTPFLLQRIVEITGGSSLEVNLEIAANNIRVAADIARAWAARA